MKITLTLDNSKLLVLNNCMAHLDGIVFENTIRRLKSSVSICIELRSELLQKAIKTRQKTGNFTLKLSYYKADALLNYLKEFEIYFPETDGIYEQTTINAIKGELHQKLL